MLDIYLQPEYSHHWPEIVRLAKLDDTDSRKKLRGYAMEACRLSSQSFGLFRRVAEDVTLEENGTTYNLKTGDEVFANLVISRVSYSNVRWEPMLILMRSLIPWKSISLVPKIHISLMDLVHTRALVRR